MRPSVAQPYDVFLNVIQFGDANTLSAMAPIARVDSSAGTSTGAHIGDAANQWVVMAARTAAPHYEIRDTTYSFTAVVPRSRHLLINMARKTTFHVKVSATGADTKVEIATGAASGGTSVVSNDQGVLSFEVNGTLVK